jgi:hypothetical protein
MIPFPNEETTQPVTKMYFVSTLTVYLVTLIQFAKVRQKVDKPKNNRPINKKL